MLNDLKKNCYYSPGILLPYSSSVAIFSSRIKILLGVFWSYTIRKWIRKPVNLFYHVWLCVHLSAAIVYTNTNIPRILMQGRRTRRNYFGRSFNSGIFGVKPPAACLSTTSTSVHGKAFSLTSSYGWLLWYFFRSYPPYTRKRSYRDDDVKCYTNPWLIWILLKKWASTLLVYYYDSPLFAWRSLSFFFL